MLLLLVKLLKSFPQKDMRRYLGGQLERSGTSPALNYAEACAAESLRDLLHKDKIILKELRETFVGLKIVDKKSYIPIEELKSTLIENNELISIFVKACEGIEKKLREKSR